MRIVYTFCKRSTKATTNTTQPEDVQEQSVGAPEAENDATTAMAAVSPVAAAAGPDHGPPAMHDTMGQSEEEQVGKNDTGTEPTTVGGSILTSPAGHAPNPQVRTIAFL